MRKQRQYVFTNHRREAEEIIRRDFSSANGNGAYRRKDGSSVSIGRSGLQGYRHRITVYSGNPSQIVSSLIRGLPSHYYQTPARKLYKQ